MQHFVQAEGVWGNRMPRGWRDFLREKKSLPVLDDGKKSELSRLLAGRVLFDTPMKEHTSLRVGGPADCLANPRTVEELKELLMFLRQENIPCTIMGRGTNLVVKDGGIRGVTIRFRDGLRQWKREGEEVLHAEGGMPLAGLVKFAIEWGLEGLEGLAGIPGSLSGAIMMNAGTRQGEIGNVVSTIGIIDGEGTHRDLRKEELGFSYRHASIPRGAVIVSASIVLRKGDRESLRRRALELLAYRRKTQPIFLPSAGSIFKNPKGDPQKERMPAGRLIEECGLKGVRVRGAQISPLHANFIVNLGGATAKDVLSLVGLIKERVYELRGVSLEPEVSVVGEDPDETKEEN